MRTDIQSETQKSSAKIPIHSEKLWGIFVLGVATITGLDMPKDWLLTGDEPNSWIYIFVPIVAIGGTAVVLFLSAHLFRRTPKFPAFLAITFDVTIAMQSVEITTKLIYLKVWDYLGWLYLVFVLPLLFSFIPYVLVCFTDVKLRMALLTTVLGIIGSHRIGVAFTEFPGLKTPSS